MEVNKRTNLVLAGAWNVSILTPEWLKKQLPELDLGVEAIPIEVALASGTPPSFRFRVRQVIIQPGPNRLELIAEEESEEVYSRISQIAIAIVDKLPHTPISAIGHNISYVLSEGESFDILEDTSLSLDGLQDYYRKRVKASAVNNMQLKHAIDYTNCTLNLTYLVRRDNLELDFNYHYEIGEGIDKKSILSEFSSNVTTAQAQARELVV